MLTIIIFFYMDENDEVKSAPLFMSQTLYKRIYPNGYRTGFDGASSDR